MIKNKKNDHSLGPDIQTGWKMRSFNHNYTQFPLYFTNPKADLISKTLTSFGHVSPYRVVYMGPRYLSNHKAFKSFCRNYNTDNSQKCDENELYNEQFQKFQFLFLQQKQKIYPIHPFEYRLFNGMNPTMKRQDISFDANFECGNLDLAILVDTNQYDLLMRVDSNTKGNTTWFFFKVSNILQNQKLKFNIINFQKSSLLFLDGMKPYCFRQSTKKWQQGGTQLSFKNKSFRYEQDKDNPIMMKCLSFQYQFMKEDQYVYFAYCIPYSYSYMLHRIQILQNKNPHFVHVNKNSFLSTGGLSIPFLTITNSSNQSKAKPVCLAIARLHPGQTQGSWVMHGFLEFICSPKGYYLRQKFIFKVFPMVNVDGVVLGNFRASIFGRDLNRVFNLPDKYSQIEMIRSVALQQKPFIFLDFHGHSAKKNVFCYGPDYGVDHKEYIPSRIFPKIISKLTTAFRYYSCNYRINPSKINAARSIMLKEHNVTFSFTIESSNYAYGLKLNQTLFNQLQYKMVGEKIAQGFEKFINVYFSIPKRLQKQKTQASVGISHEKSVRKLQNDRNVSNLLSIQRIESIFSQEQNDILSQIMKDQQQLKSSNIADEVQQNQKSSNSDFSEGNQYTEKQLQKIISGKAKVNKQQAIIKKILKPKKITKKKQRNNFSIDISPQKSIQLKKSNINKINYKNKHKVKNIEEKSHEHLVNMKSTILNQQSNKTPQKVFNQENTNLYLLNYNNWRKKHPSLLKLQKLQSQISKPSSSVNNIILDYDGGIKRFPHDEDLQDYTYHHNSRDKSSLANNRSQRSRHEKKRSLTKNKSQLYGVKEILFPIIEKNVRKHEGFNLLSQLIHENERLRDNYARKNIKIIYF